MKQKATFRPWFSPVTRSVYHKILKIMGKKRVISSAQNSHFCEI